MFHRGVPKWVLLPIAFVASFVVPAAFAQETTAGIQGVVRDPSGAAITGATVEVSGPALIGTRNVQTDDVGNYRITALPPGTYAMTITAKGFRIGKINGLELATGRLPNLDIKLEVGGVSE